MEIEMMGTMLDCWLLILPCIPTKQSWKLSEILYFTIIILFSLSRLCVFRHWNNQSSLPDLYAVVPLSIYMSDVTPCSLNLTLPFVFIWCTVPDCHRANLHLLSLFILSLWLCLYSRLCTEQLTCQTFNQTQPTIREDVNTRKEFWTSLVTYFWLDVLSWPTN